MDTVDSRSAGAEPGRNSPVQPDLTMYLTQRLGQVDAKGRPGLVRDRHFGHPTVDELVDYHARLGAGVRAQMLHGAAVHRRLPVVLRVVPWIVAVLDLAVLLSFCFDLFGVDLTDPAAVPVMALTATMLAVLGSGVGFAWLTMTGLRIRVYRNELGEVAWRALGATSWVMIGVSGVVIAALAGLMALRITDEVAEAVNSPLVPYAGLLATVFAVLGTVGNLAVIAVHALDGSWAMADLERAGRLLLRQPARPDSGQLRQPERMTEVPRPRG